MISWTVPPKEKRFVIVAITPDGVSLATVFINTNINPNVNFSQELKSLHILLSSEGRDYLNHDSFVDCTDLYEETVSVLTQAVKDDATCLLGKMDEEDLSKVHRLIMASPSIKKFKKKRYGFA